MHNLLESADDVTNELLEILLEESQEVIRQLYCLQADLRCNAVQATQLYDLKRLLHKFKGSARMSGAVKTGNLIHQIEDDLLEISSLTNKGVVNSNRFENNLTKLQAQIDLLYSKTSHDQNIKKPEQISFNSLKFSFMTALQKTANELHKKAELEILGGELLVNRGLANKLIVPLEHLICNAIVHGIESPQERIKLRKAPNGKICLTILKQDLEWVFRVEDDGGGINLAAISSEIAIQDGMNSNKEISSSDAIKVIFKKGFSTAVEVSQVSGRGMGLSVVESEVSALGGRVEVCNTKNCGVIFQICIPCE